MCAKLIVVAQKRPSRSKNTWVEVLVDDRKTLRIVLSGEDNFEEDLSTKIKNKETNH